MTSIPSAEALRLLITHNQSWFDWSTLIVVLGLVGDVGVILLYTKDKKLSEIVLSAVCTCVIIVGVYGEYHFGKEVSRENLQLQGISDAKLAGAEDRLRKAEDGLGKANERAATLGKEAEDERTARVKIEENVAWRTLNDAERGELTKHLTRFAGQFAVCNFLAGDMEAFSFSSEIAAVLRGAKWQVAPPNPNVTTVKAASLPNTASPI